MDLTREKISVLHVEEQFIQSDQGQLDIDQEVMGEKEDLTDYYY